MKYKVESNIYFATLLVSSMEKCRVSDAKFGTINSSLHSCCIYLCFFVCLHIQTNSCFDPPKVTLTHFGSKKFFANLSHDLYASYN